MTSRHNVTLCVTLRTRTRPRSRTLLTIERTCPAGASWCSWPHSRPTDPAVGRISGAGVFSLRSFSIFYFVTRLAQHPGAAPPGPKGQRGHIWLLRRSRPRSLSSQMCANRSLRGNGLKPAPDVGGVGHSCDLPLGHSCDLPLTLYRSSEIVIRSRY